MKKFWLAVTIVVLFGKCAAADEIYLQCTYTGNWWGLGYSSGKLEVGFRIDIPVRAALE